MALNGRSPSFRNNSKGAVAPSPYVCALNTLQPFITFFTIVRRCGKQYPLTVAMVFATPRCFMSSWTWHIRVSLLANCSPSLLHWSLLPSVLFYLFFVSCLLKSELWTNHKVHAVTRNVLQSVLRSRSASHWSGSLLESTEPLLFPVCALRIRSAFVPTLVVWAILLCLSTTLALQTTVPSASYRLMHSDFLSLPGS